MGSIGWSHAAVAFGGGLVGGIVGFLLASATREEVAIFEAPTPTRSTTPASGESRQAPPRAADPLPGVDRQEPGERAPAVATTAPGPSLRPASEPKPSPSARRGEASPAPVGTSHEIARDRAAEWRRKIHQIQSAQEREEALRAVEDALRSGDTQLVNAAAQVLAGMRGIEYDRTRFREPLLALLSSRDSLQRNAGAMGLVGVGGQSGDVERVLTAIDGAEPNHRPWMARSAATLNGGRVEGAVAETYVRMLKTSNLEEARDVANGLRSVWSAPEVHEAVAAAWRRHVESGEQMGLWFHILGQMTPLRPVTVELMFEAIPHPAVAGSVSLLTEPLRRSLDPELRPLVARAAAEALSKTSERRVHAELLRVLAVHGGASEARQVDWLAENAMVPEETRELARQTASALRTR